MRTPDKYLADALSFGAEVKVGERHHAKWVLARPMSESGLHLHKRCKLAWGVFVGKYDALTRIDPTKQTTK